MSDYEAISQVVQGKEKKMENINLLADFINRVNPKKYKQTSTWRD